MVAGDLNCSPHSKIWHFYELWDAHTTTCTPRFTWVGRRGSALSGKRARLDYLWMRMPREFVRRVWTRTCFGSDHKMLVADIMSPPSAKKKRSVAGKSRRNVFLPRRSTCPVDVGWDALRAQLKAVQKKPVVSERRCPYL